MGGLRGRYLNHYEVSSDSEKSTTRGLEWTNIQLHMQQIHLTRRDTLGIERELIGWFIVDTSVLPSIATYDGRKVKYTAGTETKASALSLRSEEINSVFSLMI